MSNLITTRYRIMRVDGSSEVRTAELPKEPGYDALRDIIRPLLDDNSFDRVSVLADFDEGENYRALDMFVDDEGLLKSLRRNEAATTIYRRANLMGRSALPPAKHPEQLLFIVGTVVLFDRRVWF